MIYRALFWLVLRRLSAETAHRIGFGLLRVAMAVPGAKAIARWLCGARDPAPQGGAALVFDWNAVGRTRLEP